jgi:hypothetical protein
VGEVSGAGRQAKRERNSEAAVQKREWKSKWKAHERTRKELARKLEREEIRATAAETALQSQVVEVQRLTQEHQRLTSKVRTVGVALERALKTYNFHVAEAKRLLREQDPSYDSLEEGLQDAEYHAADAEEVMAKFSECQTEVNTASGRKASAVRIRDRLFVSVMTAREAVHHAAWSLASQELDMLKSILIPAESEDKPLTPEMRGVEALEAYQNAYEYFHDTLGRTWRLMARGLRMTPLMVPPQDLLNRITKMVDEKAAQHEEAMKTIMPKVDELAAVAAEAAEYKESDAEEEKDDDGDIDEDTDTELGATVYGLDYDDSDATISDCNTAASDVSDSLQYQSALVPGELNEVEDDDVDDESDEHGEGEDDESGLEDGGENPGVDQETNGDPGARRGGEES